MTVLGQTTAVSSPEPCLSSRLVNVQGRVKLQAQATGTVSVSQHTAANRLPEPEPVSLWAYKFAQEMFFESTNFFHPQRPLATVNFSLTMYCVKKHLPSVYFEFVSRSFHFVFFSSHTGGNQEQSLLAPCHSVVSLFC